MLLAVLDLHENLLLIDDDLCGRQLLDAEEAQQELGGVVNEPDDGGNDNGPHPQRAAHAVRENFALADGELFRRNFAAHEHQIRDDHRHDHRSHGGDGLLVHIRSAKHLDEPVGERLGEGDGDERGKQQVGKRVADGDARKEAPGIFQEAEKNAGAFVAVIDLIADFQTVEADDGKLRSGKEETGGESGGHDDQAPKQG